MNRAMMMVAQLTYLKKVLVAVSEAEQISQEEHNLFIERFDELLSLVDEGTEETQYLGQQVISHIFTHYPQVGHLVPRELLWFFGGDCLHFMPDDEIVLFQQLEDLEYQAQEQNQPFNWLEEKHKLQPK